jgi:hypothetical protein
MHNVSLFKVSQWIPPVQKMYLDKNEKKIFLMHSSLVYITMAIEDML